MDLQDLRIERKTPAPRRRRSNPWPLRLVVLAVAGAAIWLFTPRLLELADHLRLPVVRVHVVTAAAPAAAAAVRGTAANGYVVAARRAALSSDVPGRIVELSVREGSVVAKGDVVARLFADEYRAALQRAEAELLAASAGVARAEAAAVAAGTDVAHAVAAQATAAAQQLEAAATLRFTDAERVRAEELVRTGVGSPRDVERALSERDAQQARGDAAASAAATAAAAVATARARVATAAADVDVARASVAAAAAARDLAQATLDKTDVRAPFDGIVVLKDAEVGEVVSPNVQGGSTARGAVCTLVDFDSLEVQAHVPETTLAAVEQGAPAAVFLDAFPDQRHDGVVDRIWPTADRQKATVEVRVRLLQRDPRLRPEMGVRVVFGSAGEGSSPTTPAAAALLVPDDAIVDVAGARGAFVLERDIVRFTPVRTGTARSGRVAVDDGLVAGQRIVLAPPASLQDGDRVRVDPGTTP